MLFAITKNSFKKTFLMMNEFSFFNELGKFIWKKKGIPTAYPIRGEDSIRLICNTIKEAGQKYSAIGIASFGPIKIAEGKIGNTTKPNWKHFPLIAEIRKNLNKDIPIILETDVNAPAYSEYLALHEKGIKTKSLAYLTVGTGVGLDTWCSSSRVRPHHS